MNAKYTLFEACMCACMCAAYSRLTRIYSQGFLERHALISASLEEAVEAAGIAAIGALRQSEISRVSRVHQLSGVSSPEVLNLLALLVQTDKF